MAYVGAAWTGRRWTKRLDAGSDGENVVCKHGQTRSEKKECWTEREYERRQKKLWPKKSSSGSNSGSAPRTQGRNETRNRPKPQKLGLDLSVAVPSCGTD